MKTHIGKIMTFGCCAYVVLLVFGLLPFNADNFILYLIGILVGFLISSLVWFVENGRNQAIDDEVSINRTQSAVSVTNSSIDLSSGSTDVPLPLYTSNRIEDRPPSYKSRDSS